MNSSAGAATPFCTLSPRDYDAVLFDLDGVLTSTASARQSPRSVFRELVEDPLLRAISHGACLVPAHLNGPRSVMFLAETLQGEVINRRDADNGTSARSTSVESR